MEKPTLIIGDVHGHFDRFEALLEQEGIIEDGQRVNHEARVIQLGDLGDFAERPTGDSFCYRAAALDNWVDLVLWGNHDRAVVDSRSTFNRFQMPDPEIKHYMRILMDRGKLKLATTAFDNLVVHAGLHRFFEKMFDRTKNPAEVVKFIEQEQAKGLRSDLDFIWTAIGRPRGGHSDFGGILWKDWNESWYRYFPTICGHSKALYTREDNFGNLCVDVGTRDNGRLAGVWLNSKFDREIVEVDTSRTNLLSLEA